MQGLEVENERGDHCRWASHVPRIKQAIPLELPRAKTAEGWVAVKGVSAAVLCYVCLPGLSWAKEIPQEHKLYAGG